MAIQIGRAANNWGGANLHTRNDDRSSTFRQMTVVPPPAAQRVAMRINGACGTSLAKWSFAMIEPGNAARVASSRKTNTTALRS